MRVPIWIAILGLIAGCERGPALRQPVGESTGGTTRVTSASMPSRPLDSQAAALIEQARREQQACAGTVTSIGFAFDSAVVDVSEGANLQRLAQCLTTPPLAMRTVLLVGHADEIGPANYNLVLGLERAKNVKEQLVKYGLPPERITTASSGEAGAAREGEAHARRVDVWIRRDGSEPSASDDRARVSP